MCLSMCFFFFQAEDGIRDLTVTGVQTCALPIWVETIARLWDVCPALQVVVCTAYADYSWDDMRAKVGQPDSLVILKKPFDNIEVRQLAHALTKKWWLNLRSELQLAELAQANTSL